MKGINSATGVVHLLKNYNSSDDIAGCIEGLNALLNNPNIPFLIETLNSILVHAQHDGRITAILDGLQTLTVQAQKWFDMQFSEMQQRSEQREVWREMVEKRHAERCEAVEDDAPDDVITTEQTRQKLEDIAEFCRKIPAVNEMTDFCRARSSLRELSELKMKGIVVSELRADGRLHYLLREDLGVK